MHVSEGPSPFGHSLTPQTLRLLQVPPRFHQIREAGERPHPVEGVNPGSGLLETQRLVEEGFRFVQVPPVDDQHVPHLQEVR